MSVNPQLLYQSLLAETDQEANQEYEVDPRVAQYALRNTNDDREVPGFSARVGEFAPPGEEQNLTGIDQQEYDTYAVPEIPEPKFVEAKRVVIVDTALRDWTVQQDAYNNVQFSFNAPTAGSSVSNAQVPFYFNNPVIPYSAYEMPYVPPNQPSPPQVANIKKRSIPSENNNITEYGLLANVYGWRIVKDQNGRIVHFNQVSEPFPPSYTVVYFPVYDSTNSRGARIGVDSVVANTGDVLDQFSTQEQISNVAGIRLLRATLPFRKFDSFPAGTYLNSDPSRTPIANSVANLFNTFNSEPCIYLGFASLTGNYLGAGQVAQNAFCALVQSNRQAIPANSSTYINQYQDYYPWGNEEYKFDPPLSYLSNASLVLSNGYGVAFSHLDNINITGIAFGTDLSIGPIPGNTSGALYFPLGLMTFSVLRGTVPSNYVNLCSAFFSSSNLFSTNDIRPGDEIILYQPAVSNLMSDPSSNPAINAFFQNLLACNMLVTSVNTAQNLGFTGYPMIEAAYEFTAIPKMTTIESAVNNTQTICALIQQQQGVSAIYLTPTWNSNTGTCNTSFNPSQQYAIPIMNRMMQCTYAFEITTLVPQNDAIPGTIVKETIR